MMQTIFYSARIQKVVANNLFMMKTFLYYFHNDEQVLLPQNKVPAPSYQNCAIYTDMADRQTHYGTYNKTTGLFWGLLI